MYQTPCDRIYDSYKYIQIKRINSQHLGEEFGISKTHSVTITAAITTTKLQIGLNIAESKLPYYIIRGVCTYTTPFMS